LGTRDGRRGHGLGPVPSHSFRAVEERRAGMAVTMSEAVLDNGIRVISERMPGVRSAAVGVWVRRGAAHEGRADEGVSHLLEHMVFKGTRRRDAQEIALALESLGGSLDAYTSREHTSYQARALDEHLPIGLDVLADLVLDPLLRAEDLELEREVVLEEIAQVDDTPDDLVFELHADRLWRGHPYGRPILGTEETVAEMSAERIQDVHGQDYVGANLVVAGTGNLEHEDFLERVRSLFGGVGRGAPVASVDAPEGTSRGMVHVPRESAQTHIVFGAEGPSHGSDDRHPVVLLSAALGGGMSSRLFQRVREELGLCYSIFSYHSFYRESGMSGVYVGTRPATADQAASAVLEELAVVAREGMAEHELDRIKQQVKGQIMLALESTSARLYRLASFALYDEPYLTLDEVLERIDRVTRDDIVRVAGEYFDPGAQLELRLGPA